jgi:uncharacterized repeat protein (TIGR02543 family)
VYTVTFDSQDANTPANPATISIPTTSRTVAALPNNPKKTGYNFDGWWTEKEGKGTQFTASTIITSNITVYAKWNIPTAESSFTVAVSGDTVTITAYSGTDTVIVIPETIGGHSVTGIGEKTFYMKAITSVTIPSSVTSIGIQAFAFCSNLTSVTIPNSVTSIASIAFRECTSLTSVTILGSVKSIDACAFYRCYSLTSVTVNATTPPTLGTDVFTYHPTTFAIKVPSASVDAYKTASNWSAWATWIE